MEGTYTYTQDGYSLALSLYRLTPLDYAVQNGHSECAEVLKKHGAVAIATIREMAAICIQTIFRGFR